MYKFVVVVVVAGAATALYEEHIGKPTEIAGLDAREQIEIKTKLLYFISVYIYIEYNILIAVVVFCCSASAMEYQWQWWYVPCTNYAHLFRLSALHIN